MDRKERYARKVSGQVYETWYGGTCCRCGGTYKRYDQVVELRKREVAHERCVFGEVSIRLVGEDADERRSATQATG